MTCICHFFYDIIILRILKCIIYNVYKAIYVVYEVTTKKIIILDYFWSARIVLLFANRSQSYTSLAQLIHFC